MSCWSWCHQIFETDRRNVKRRTECFSGGFWHVCEEERWHAISLHEFINEIHLRTATVRFLRSLPLNKPFYVISEPAFTEANKALEHLLKISENRATLPAYYSPKDQNGKRPNSNEQVKKLFDSGELGREENKNPAQLQGTT